MYLNIFEMKDKLTLGFSSCPNDTFIFDALANKHINTEGIDFEIIMEDIETLNQLALKGKLDITKVSFITWLKLTKKYKLLHTGSALGKGCGPLLISRTPVDKANIPLMTIAIPGINTTANMLLNFAFPFIENRKSMLFSKIEESVLKQETDLGVIIHESRFTYQSKGLIKIMDLGEYWEEKTGCPIPLAGIAIKNKIHSEIRKKVDKLIKQSIEYAFLNYPTISEYVKMNAKEMDESVMRNHIDLYVNDYSFDLGNEGLRSLNILADQAHSAGILIQRPQIVI